MHGGTHCRELFIKQTITYAIELNFKRHAAFSSAVSLSSRDYRSQTVTLRIMATMVHCSDVLLVHWATI